MIQTAINPAPKSIVTAAALVGGLLLSATPAQAMNFTPLTGFNYATIFGPEEITDGSVNIGTVGASTAVDGDSVTVNAGSLLSPLVPVGGAGYLYEASSAGSVTFDWEFITENPEAFFGFGQFDDRSHLTNTINSLNALGATLNPGDPVPESFYDSFTYAFLADGASSSGQYTVNFEAGNIFGFGLALEGLDAALFAEGNLNLGSFTITPQGDKPTDVPTPAAVLPVIGGLFSAAKRRNQSTK